MTVFTSLSSVYEIFPQYPLPALTCHCPLCQSCRMLRKGEVAVCSEPAASPLPLCKPRKPLAPPGFSFAFCDSIRVVLLLESSKPPYTDIFHIPPAEFIALSYQRWSFCSVVFLWRCCTPSLLLCFCTRAVSSFAVPCPECYD